MNMSERPAFKFVTRTVEYRIYYNPQTKFCVSKSLGSNGTKDPYVVVDKELYDSIDSCSKYKVTNGQIEMPSSRNSTYKKLHLSPTGKFKTTKNNLIFVTDCDIDVDRWDFINE